jgi:hypothetical protein
MGVFCMTVSISGTSGITFPDGSLQTAAASPLVLRNRIINGAMVVDQRNAGASVTPTNGQYTLDRWQAILTQSSKYTVQQNAGSVTPPAGFTNYLGITSSSAYSITSGDIFNLTQTIEGYNIADLGYGTANAKTTTLSFWVYSSLTGTFGLTVNNDGATRTYCTSYTISSANTWQQVSISIPGDTSGTWLKTNGSGIQYRWGLGVGSTYSGAVGSWSGNAYFGTTGATSVVGTNGATFYITGVQLEIGSTATPFERRLYSQELANCQRYYWKTFPVETAPAQNVATGNQIFTYGVNNISSGVLFPVSMRATPTITTFNPYAANSSFRVPNSATDVSVTPTELSSSGICYFLATRTAPSALHGQVTASAEL